MVQVLTTPQHTLVDSFDVPRQAEQPQSESAPSPPEPPQATQCPPSPPTPPSEPTPRLVRQQSHPPTFRTLRSPISARTLVFSDYSSLSSRPSSSGPQDKSNQSNNSTSSARSHATSARGSPSVRYPHLRPSASTSNASSPPRTPVDRCVSPYSESPYYPASPVFSYRSLHSEPCYDRILQRRAFLSELNERLEPLHSNMASGLKRKVVILGSPSVGKTSITQQFVTPPTYNDQYYPTIESTSQKIVKYKGVEYDCEIVDTAGQDEFSLFPPKYAVGVHGYMLVYAITSRQSFDMIQQLHEKILDQGGLDRVPCVIVGQKSDLANDRRVSTAEGEALAKKIGAAFIESSAKDNKNIDRAFDALLAEMQREYNPEAKPVKKGWWPF